MNIQQTQFDSNYHGNTEKGCSTYEYYTFHEVDVFNEIIIDGEVLQAVYQTGMSNLHNDYSCPDPDLEMSEEGGASHILYLVSNMYESDFDNQEIVEDILLEVRELSKVIKTKEDIYQLWDFLRNNKPCIEDYIENDLED